MKPKILVVADIPNWAYHSIQLFIKKTFNKDYRIYSDFLVFNRQKSSNGKILSRIKQFLKLSYLRAKYQRRSVSREYDLVIFLGYYFTDTMVINFNYKKKLVGIYTDGFPPQCADSNVKTIEDFKNRYLVDADGIVCGSEQIRKFFEPTFTNTYYANASLDINMFSSKRDISVLDDCLYIGWTGNPERGFKHYYDIIVPAVEKAKTLREGIFFNTRFSGPIETLPDFYEEIDIVLIASDKDAGPSLFMEASYMNVPSISTRIGWPDEVILDGENGYLVNGDIDSFVDAIIKLYDDKQLLLNMKKRIRRDAIDKLGDNISKKRWEDVFASLDI